MSALYPQLRNLHLACIVVSIALFVLRHVLNLRGINWRKSRALRIMPHVVDGLLLASGIVLCVAIAQYPFSHSWLTVKLVALVGYILLASQALKAGRSLVARRVAFMAAVALFGFMATVARTHSPAGIFGQFW